jgi:hydrogenase nickel incorporation protein HypB
MMPTKRIEVVTRILDANQRVADEIRHKFSHANLLAINLISSPGSGKTLLLEKTVPLLKLRGVRCGVIAGDIATSADAERISAHGAPVVQITTESFGGACHLEAPAVLQALDHLPLNEIDVLFIENVGNLVCPAEFDVGEALRVVMISITEGEDKPLKYPLSFRVTDCCLISKIDLLPHLKISIEKLHESLDRINPEAERIEISSQKGDGLNRWIDWLVDMNSQKTELLSHSHQHEETAGHTHSHGHHH